MNNPFFNSILRSSTDFRFYRDVFSQRAGDTLRYLLFFALMVTAVLAVKYGFIVSRFSGEALDWIRENAPPVEIKDGVVYAAVKQPYIVEKDNFSMIIDTTGQVTEIKTEEGILLSRNKIIIKDNDIRTQQFDISKVKSFKLDEASLSGWRRFLVSFIILIMFIMMFVSFFAGKIIQALIFGAAVVAFKPSLSYQNILNICVYALTPVTILSLFVALVSQGHVPFFWIIYLGMYITFISGALRHLDK